MNECSKPLAGQTLRFRVLVKNAAQVLTDPLTFSPVVVDRHGSSLPVTVEHPSVGTYYVSVTPGASGGYVLHVEATSPPMLAEHSFSVGRPVVSPVMAWSGSAGGLGATPGS